MFSSLGIFSVPGSLTRIVFDSPKQWQGIVAHIQSGEAMCPGCGKWVIASRIVKVPRRIRKQRKALRVDVVPKYLCGHCVAKAIVQIEQRLRPVCVICGKKFARKKSGRSRKQGEGHLHFGHCDRNLDWRMEQALYKYHPSWQNHRYGPTCEQCTSARAEEKVICYARWKASQHFRQLRTVAIKREQSKNESVSYMTYEEWQQTLAYFGEACAYCGSQWQVMEHFVPVENGGRFVARNILPACQRCNLTKRSMPALDWLKKCTCDQQDHIIEWTGIKAVAEGQLVMANTPQRHAVGAPCRHRPPALGRLHV